MNIIIIIIYRNISTNCSTLYPTTTSFIKGAEIKVKSIN